MTSPESAILSGGPAPAAATAAEPYKTSAGVSHPLGAYVIGTGVNFALYSRHATRVELCLFGGETDETESARLTMQRAANNVWHIHVDGLKAGQLYGYRVEGPFDPQNGHRFNHNKLLIDPYARAITGDVVWNDALFGYIMGDPRQDLSFDERNSAAYMPKCVVVNSQFDWAGDRHPHTPYSESLMYEMHVRGWSMQHPDIPEALRGTYLALTTDTFLDHIKKLGVTAVELLPVHHCVNRRRLIDLGLVNYWGYDSVNFFAPDPWFATGKRGQQVDEFKQMVKTLHAHGIEVILDVVYNHTVEGDQFGPTLSWRGIDNAVYYRLQQRNKRFVEDFTGVGNSLNLLHARCLQMVMDSLRYWVQEMHVDGFRFDLASTLARGVDGVDPHSSFIAAIEQDPTLAHTKLIAEPWDVGYGGYRLGWFPSRWAEWNDKYRDNIRRYWRGDRGQVAELAFRLTGSSDLFGHKASHPLGSVNFVACHDGATLHDFVTYEGKYNLANGEDNRDGHHENFSRNWGHEGETIDPKVRNLREQIKRSIIATLAFSQGIPMLWAGDEMGHSQQGNNNAYCQDNDISWLNWDLGAYENSFLRFVRRVMQIRRDHPAISRPEHLEGTVTSACGLKDVTWLKQNGLEMTQADWYDANRTVLGMLAHEHELGPVENLNDCEREDRDTVLMLLNAGEHAIAFTLPAIPFAGRWVWLLNTEHAVAKPDEHLESKVRVGPHALALLHYRH